MSRKLLVKQILARSPPSICFLVTSYCFTKLYNYGAGLYCSTVLMRCNLQQECWLLAQMPDTVQRLLHE